MWDPYVDFKTTVLGNGLTVYQKVLPHLPFVTVGLLVHTGAMNDPAGKEGLAHFVEHVVSSNSGMNSQEIDDFFSECGGGVNLGSTSYQGISFNFVLPNEACLLHKSFNIFRKLLLTGNITDESGINDERKVIHGEYRIEYPLNFSYPVKRRRMEKLFGEAWPVERFTIIGTPNSIDSITREDIVQYYADNFTPANISIVVIGGLNSLQLQKTLKETGFCQQKPGIRNPLPKPPQIIVGPSEDLYKFVISDHFNQQSSLNIAGYETHGVFSYNRDYSSIVVLEKMLSRVLFDTLRQEKGWTYATSSRWQIIGEYILFSATVDAVPPEVIGQVKDLVDEIIASLSKDQQLFEKSRRQILAQTTISDRNSFQIRSDVMSDLEKIHSIETLSEYYIGIEKVTFADVIRLIELFSPKKRWTHLSVP